MNLKGNKGIGLTDAVIATAILAIFTTIIISVSYNIYLQSNFIKRNDNATNYIVSIFEYSQKILYSDISSENLINYVDTLNDKNVKAIEGKYQENSEKLAPYTVFINVEEPYENYIKRIDVTVMYKLSKKTKTVSMSTLINK